MTEPVTAQQIFRHLSLYDLNRVTFQMADGLPVIAVYIDPDEKGGAVITVSDQLNDKQIFAHPRVLKKLHHKKTGSLRE